MILNFTLSFVFTDKIQIRKKQRPEGEGENPPPLSIHLFPDQSTHPLHPLLTKIHRKAGKLPQLVFEARKRGCRRLDPPTRLTEITPKPRDKRGRGEVKFKKKPTTIPLLQHAHANGGNGRGNGCSSHYPARPFLRPLRGTLALAAVVAAGEKQQVFPGHLSASVIPVHCSPASPGGATVGPSG